ncbi:MAG: hypothetical protein IEMM0008_1565 [bacterium]|nr:MAG: hypothetical protein IEMM0008_1565 [bacterium]
MDLTIRFNVVLFDFFNYLAYLLIRLKDSGENSLSLLFEWDETKAKLNISKHKVAFEEATTLFDDSLSITIEDPMHSSGEERFITIGLSYMNRLLVIAHCDREDQIRIISARLTTSKERKVYEKGR